MRSILIKGMETPHCCVVCPCKEMYPDGLLCKATSPHNYIPNFFHKRYEKCPLVEVPTPHGRLIDAEKLMIAVLKAMNSEEDISVIGLIDRAPTIIEAEDAER